MLLCLESVLLIRKIFIKRRIIVSFCGWAGMLLLFIIQLPLFVVAQNRSAKFIHLKTNDGLSQEHVSSILKDKKGFMWFGTDGGLNKYDGYRFTVYKHDEDKPASISNDIVYDVLEDKAGNIWVATYEGLDRLDRKKDNFIHYTPGNHAIVHDVFEDSRGFIWAGTSKGLYVLNASEGTFKPYIHNSNDKNSLSDNLVNKIAEDNDHELWLATRNGLNRFNPASGLFTRYKTDSRNRGVGEDWVNTVYKDSKGKIWAGTQGSLMSYDPLLNSFACYHHTEGANSVINDDVLSLCEDGKGNLWIGTENGGISVFNPAQKTFVHYKKDRFNPDGLGNNSVNSLYMDSQKTMWIGTYSDGINILPGQDDKFSHYTQSLTLGTSLNDGTVLSVSEDSKSNLWIGTDGGGLNKLDKKSGNFTYYEHDAHNPNSIRSNYVKTVIQINNDVLGLGLYQGGFDLLNTKTGKFSHHIPEKGNVNSISSFLISSLCKSRDGKIWIGTWGGGLNRYEMDKNAFTHYQNNPNDKNSISSNGVNWVLEDKENNLWIGTDNGLDRLKRDGSGFDHYRHEGANKKSLSQNLVTFLFEDKKGSLWIGTSEGLNLYDKKKKTFTAFTEKNGLANNSIQGILEDRQGLLWISSNAGLTRFDPVSKTSRNYEISDGLQGKQFKPGSCLAASDGRLFFGGTNGFNAFYPDSLKDNIFIPPVYITDFQIFNKSVGPGGKGTPLQQQISEAKEITLSYKQSVFSFEFAALSYMLPGKNQYAYRLEGFDKSWNYSGSKRTATYTNLDPGTYTFNVKGSNNDLLWNETPASVKITILPPYWLTWWFKLLVIIAFTGSVVAFYWSRTRDIEEQRNLLEQKVQQQTSQLVRSNEEEKKARQEADEANRAKGVFLATMSHEIRTPMNGVIGIASLLMQTKLDNEQKNYAKTIATCGESLLSVINGVLDFSKVESGKMELENELFDLKVCIEESLEIFFFAASEKGIKLEVSIDASVPTHIFGDCLRLRQVLVNLVGNAIKFTNRGKISIGVKLLQTPENSPMQLEFEVRDTGIGIPDNKLEKLFKAFEQLDSSTTRKYGGTGLGLIICEKLITLMGGTIKVASEHRAGTTFTFSIQTKTGKQDAPAAKAGSFVAARNKPDNDRRTPDRRLTPEFAKQYPLRILVAEDNAINMMIIKNILSRLGYEAATAENGQEVLDRLHEDFYDLVLMDLQMPVMDGLEATRIIRQSSQEQPCIIAITANAMQGDKEECIEAGMNDYMSKPININVLTGLLAKWSSKTEVV